IIVLALAGFFSFRGITALMGRIIPTPSATPAPSASATPAPSATATPKPSTAPAETYTPTTKGGVQTGTVKGVTTAKKTTTTTTTSHLKLTLVKTSTCPISYMTEVKDITGPLTLRYELKDGSSFGITIWKKDGNELFNNTTFGGRSGTITTISGV